MNNRDIPQDTLSEIPNGFMCPITNEIMEDPVVTADGHTYERRAITEWFTRSHRSPATGLELPNLNLVTNFNLRKAIDEYKGSLPEIKKYILSHEDLLKKIQELEIGLKNRDGKKEMKNSSVKIAVMTLSSQSTLAKAEQKEDQMDIQKSTLPCIIL
jgi:hypothetical protein